MTITLDNINDNLFIGNKLISTLFYEGFKEAIFQMRPALSEQIEGLNGEEEFYDWVTKVYDNVKNLNKDFPHECAYALLKINRQNIIENNFNSNIATISKVGVSAKQAANNMKKLFDSIAINKELTDNVNHPSHYTQGKVECINALDAATEGLSGIEAVCTANAIKYLWRWKYKNGVEDLKKAIWYINHLIDSLDNNK